MTGMEATIRVKAGVPTGGQFDRHYRDESSVALLDSPGWSTDPSLVTVIESPVGPEGNFHVGMQPAALQVFQMGFGHEIDDPEGVGDALVLSRGDDGTVTARVSVESVDFSDIETGIDDDLRAKYESEINDYLLDNYGVINDTATDWDDSTFNADVDITEYCTTENGEAWITTSNALSVVYSDTRVKAFVREINDGTLFTKLNTHLRRLG